MTGWVGTDTFTYTVSDGADGCHRHGHGHDRGRPQHRIGRDHPVQAQPGRAHRSTADLTGHVTDRQRRGSVVPGRRREPHGQAERCRPSTRRSPRPPRTPAASMEALAVQPADDRHLPAASEAGDEHSVSRLAPLTPSLDRDLRRNEAALSATLATVNVVRRRPRTGRRCALERRTHGRNLGARGHAHGHDVVDRRERTFSFTCPPSAAQEHLPGQRARRAAAASARRAGDRVKRLQGGQSQRRARRTPTSGWRSRTPARSGSTSRTGSCLTPTATSCFPNRALARRRHPQDPLGSRHQQLQEPLPEEERRGTGPAAAPSRSPTGRVRA